MFESLTPVVDGVSSKAVSYTHLKQAEKQKASSEAKPVPAAKPKTNTAARCV